MSEIGTPPAGGDAGGAPATPPGEGSESGKSGGGPPASGGDQNQAFARLQRELRQAQKERDDFKAADEARKTADLSDSERWKKTAGETEAQANQLKAELKTTRMQHRFETAAAKAGAVDPQDLWRLADLSSLEYDEKTGKVEGVDDLVKALKAAKPYLFGTSTPPGLGSAGGNPSGGSGAKTLTSEQVKAMDAKSFAQLQLDVAAGRVKLT